MHVPCVSSPKHLWTLRHQLLKSDDRVAILHNQMGVWADDEFRFHIAILLQMRNEQTYATQDFSDRKCISLDQLLLTGWVHHGDDQCPVWAQSHSDVLAQGTIIVSACMISNHWIPVVLTPTANVLHFSTWDSPTVSHDKVIQVVRSIGHALGFDSVSYTCHKRLFLTSDNCGALAVAFLHHVFFGSMLPTSNDEAALVHARLRACFLQEISACQLAPRPWIWGSGDEQDEFTNEPGRSSHDPPPNVAAEPTIAPAIDPPNAVACGSHICIGKENRMQLLRDKGKLWGDDEIRYHIQQMINHPQCVVNSAFATIPGFVTLDPLFLTTWDSIGKPMCDAWCRRNMVVITHGFHIVAAFLHLGHWFPVWIVPHGKTLVANTIEDGVVDVQVLLPMLRVLQEQFGFQDVSAHSFPPGLPSPDMCGAMAIAFLGQVIVGAPLPQTIHDLGCYHANMKASFVQALYEGTCCICPVAWGAGPDGALIKMLSDELMKHGVPDNMVEQRAQQALRAIGTDQIQQAMKSRNVWRSLKVLGNNVRFQFLLPEELANVAMTNKGIPIGKRMQQPAPKPRPNFPTAVDPSRLTLPDGVFHASGTPVPQISAKQLSPLAHGIALVTVDEAMPYLRAGKVISSEPLALAVFTSAGTVIDTILPHTTVMMPCVCITNNEPILTEVVVVQVGKGFVEKQVLASAISMDQLDVVTIKVMVYKDEVSCAWEEFAGAPVKYLVKAFPILKRCHEDGCQCDSWHNQDNLPVRDPIMDVWRRQWLKMGFKQCKSNQAEIFRSVSESRR